LPAAPPGRYAAPREPSQPALTNPYEPAGDFAAEAAALEAARLDDLDAWAAGMARHPQGGEWRKRGERLLAENQAGARAQYAHAALLAAQGERAEAARLLVGLCERLAQAGAWTAVALVARRALTAEAGPPAARWLVRAADETGSEEERFVALEEAHAGAPGEARLAWRLARQYEALGDRRQALATTARALEALARRHDAEGMEEALLAVLDESDPAFLRLTLPPLPPFAKAARPSAWRASSNCLARAARGRAGGRDLADAARDAARAGRARRAGRPRARGGGGRPAARAAARALLADAGYGSEPAAAWLPLFERLLPFARAPTPSTAPGAWAASAA